MTSKICSIASAERLDCQVMQIRKIGFACSTQVSTWKRVVIGIIVSTLVLTSVSRPARADTPLAGVAVAFVVGVLSGLAANAIYDAVTSDTTTTTTTTTTDKEGNTTTTTTTTTHRSTATPTPPETPGFLSVNGTVVKNIVTDRTIGQMIGRTHDTADVLLTDGNIRSIHYAVERSVKTVLQRKVTFPEEGADLFLNLNFDELLVATRDIPKLNGSSNMTVTIAINREVLYTFHASVEQGKSPVFNDAAATQYVVKQANDILFIDGFKKRLEFHAEPGRVSDEIIVTILTEGMGKRI